MDYLLLEMAMNLKQYENTKRDKPEFPIDILNANMEECENEMLDGCLLEDFLDAKSYYERKIAKGEKTGLLGISLQDLLDYTDKLIAMKRERER